MLFVAGLFCQYVIIMLLSLQESVEIILLCGREGWTQKEIAAEFNNNHLERNLISQNEVAEFFKIKVNRFSC
jgi:hypothetical protein